MSVGVWHAGTAGGYNDRRHCRSVGRGRSVNSVQVASAVVVCADPRPKAEEREAMSPISNVKLDKKPIQALRPLQAWRLEMF